MLVNKLKTVLLAGLILLAVGLVGCDNHGHHNDRYIRAGRGNDIHRGGRRYSYGRKKSHRRDDFYKSHRSEKLRRHKSDQNAKKSSDRSKFKVGKNSKKSGRSRQISSRDKRRVNNHQNLQRRQNRRRFDLARGDNFGANHDILLEKPDRKKKGSRSRRSRRRK